MNEVIFSGYCNINWTCPCGAYNIEEHLKIDFFNTNNYECKSCGKKYSFRITGLDIEEIEDEE